MVARWQAIALGCALSTGGAVAAASAPAARPDAAFEFALGELLAAEGDYDGALAALDRAIELEPGDAYLRLERAELMFRVGRQDAAAAEIGRARQLAPEDPEVQRIQARIEMSRAERDPQAARVAIDAYERVRARDPADLEALVSLGQLYLAGGLPTQAKEPLAEAARLRPGQPMIEALLARALASAGEPDDAEAVQRRLLAREPANLEQRLELAELLGRQGRHAEAATLLADAPDAQRESLEVRRRLGYELYRAGDLDSAAVVGEAALAAQPDAVGARLLLALVGLASGRYAEVERRLAPLAQAEVPNEQVAELYVRALEGLGRVDEAVEMQRRRERALADAGRGAEAAAARLDRALLLARAERWAEVAVVAGEMRAGTDAEEIRRGTLLLAEALAEQGETERALALFAAVDASAPALLARRAELLLAAGRGAEADSDLRALLELEDGDLRVAEVHQRREDYAASIPLLEGALARDPDSLEASFRLATALERVGRIPEAVGRLRGLVARAPAFAPALNYLGYLWIERSENLDQAVAMVREAVRLDPDNGAYVDSLGWGYFKLGRYSEAVTHLERAVRLIPDDSTLLEHLGDAHLATGDRARARDAYRRAIALGGDDAARVAGKLESLGGDS